MPRRRRVVDPEGRVECSLCGEGIYIWNFYTEPVDPEDEANIWFRLGNRVWGKPKGYCKACNRVATKGKEAIQWHRFEADRQRANRVDDVDQAHKEALRVQSEMKRAALGMPSMDEVWARLEKL
jgi:hypothetical protein